MYIYTAKDIMTTDIHAVDADWSIPQLAEFFDENNISGAPVTDHSGELVGVVSSTDIVRHDSSHLDEVDTDDNHDYYIGVLQYSVAREELRSIHLQNVSNSRVKDIMTPLVFEVTEDTNVSDIADTMIRGHIHRVLVTREKRVVGIITTMDMLKVVRDGSTPEAKTA